MSLGSNRCCSLPTNTNVVGPQGANGPYGSIGQIGITGSIGVTGATGLCYRGRQGLQGPVGEQGGSTGNTGPPGPQGTSGLTTGINRNFSFTTGSTASYNTVYTDLTGFTSTSITKSVILLAGTYSINWEILEGWTDTENKFYVRLTKNDLTPIHISPIVFNAISPCVLYSNSTQITGIGNDVITIVDLGVYSIELFQSTNSTSIIQIGTKPIKFSITFVQIS